MATSIEIFNAAATILGQSGISSFDTEDVLSRQAKAIYNLTRDEVLRAHPWNCAVKRISLAASADTPLFDYTYQYTLPSDWLKTLQVGEYGVESDYRAEGRSLLLNESGPLYFRYIYKNYDETTWDSLLTMTMVYSLCEKFSYLITGSPNILELVSAKLKECRREARAVDGQDEPPESFGDYPLRQVR